VTAIPKIDLSRYSEEELIQLEDLVNKGRVVEGESTPAVRGNGHLIEND
jgi:hypothetical protein